MRDAQRAGKVSRAGDNTRQSGCRGNDLFDVLNAQGRFNHGPHREVRGCAQSVQGDRRSEQFVC